MIKALIGGTESISLLNHQLFNNPVLLWGLFGIVLGYIGYLLFLRYRLWLDFIGGDMP